MYKIDAHCHPNVEGFDVVKMLDNMDALGIGKACLLTVEGPMDEHLPNATAPDPSYPVPFASCLSAKEKAPERFILGYAPDPRVPTSLQKLKNAVENYGVQVCGEVKFRMMYDNPDAVDIFRYCGEVGLPVVLHMDYAYARKPKPEAYHQRHWFGGDIDTLERILQLCPKTNFLGHAPGFWACISNSEEWKTVVTPKGPVVRGGRVERLLEKYSNLYCDCSAGSGLNALSRDPEYTRSLMLKYPDRFLYGRDCFDDALAQWIRELDLPQDILERFYYQNFEALLPTKQC